MQSRSADLKKKKTVSKKVLMAVRFFDISVSSHIYAQTHFHNLVIITARMCKESSLCEALILKWLYDHL